MFTIPETTISLAVHVGAGWAAAPGAVARTSASSTGMQANLGLSTTYPALENAMDRDLHHLIEGN